MIFNQRYIEITKPKIVLGNIINFIGGFVLASNYSINYKKLLLISICLIFIISSGCILNNYIDIDIDNKMQRTKNRILVNKYISIQKILSYTLTLNMIGFLLLFINVDLFTILLTLIGLIIYVILYSLYLKRKYIGTIIGSLSGAMPIIIGYHSVHNNFNICSCILLLVLIIWQMSHVYIIIISRLKDYQKTNILTLPTKYNILITKKYIFLYIVILIILINILSISNYISYSNCFIITFLGINWLKLTIIGIIQKDTIDSKIWIKNMFFYSIKIILILNLMIIFDYIFFKYK